MKKSTTPTNLIAVKALTSSEWDNIDFVLIDLSPGFIEWLGSKSDLAKRLGAEDENFFSIEYHYYPRGWYVDTSDEPLFEEDQDEWFYVELEPGEQLTEGEQRISVSTILFTEYGFSLSGTGKHTGESFWTDTVDAAQLEAAAL